MPIIKTSDIADKVLSVVDEVVGDMAGMCVYATSFGYAFLTELGMTVDIFGGSMYWPITEDGSESEVTHLVYKWEDYSDAEFTMCNEGCLPEMHLWLGIRESYQIVDFSTGKLKDVAENIGLKWETEDPPRYLWSNKVPRGVMYVPEQMATCYAKSKVIECLHHSEAALGKSCSVEMPELLFQIGQEGTLFLH